MNALSYEDVQAMEDGQDENAVSPKNAMSYEDVQQMEDTYGRRGSTGPMLSTSGLMVTRPFGQTDRPTSPVVPTRFGQAISRLPPEKQAEVAAAQGQPYNPGASDFELGASNLATAIPEAAVGLPAKIGGALGERFINPRQNIEFVSTDKNEPAWKRGLAGAYLKLTGPSYQEQTADIPSSSALGALGRSGADVAASVAPFVLPGGMEREIGLTASEGIAKVLGKKLAESSLGKLGSGAAFFSGAKLVKEFPKAIRDDKPVDLLVEALGEGPRFGGQLLAAPHELISAAADGLKSISTGNNADLYKSIREAADAVGPWAVIAGLHALGEKNAVQEPGAGEVFQRQPGQVGEAGGGRGGMEQGVQGPEAAQAGLEEAATATGPNEAVQDEAVPANPAVRRLPTKAEVTSSEWADQFARDHPDKAEALAQIESPTRRQFEKLVAYDQSEGRLTPEEKATVSANLMDALTKPFDERSAPPAVETQSPLEAPAEGPTETSLPGYVQDEIDRRHAEAEKAGVLDRLEQLAAQRLTLGQIAGQPDIRSKFPGKTFDEVKDVLNGARTKLGIPSMEERPEFEAWLKQRSPSPPGAASVAAGTESAPEAKIEPPSLEKSASESMDWLRKRFSGSTLQSSILPGLDPEVLKHLAIVGAHQIVKGYERIAEFTKAMIEALPEMASAIREHADSILKAARTRLGYPSEESATSIKNAVVDKEREARGQAPMMQKLSGVFGGFWNEAMRRIDSDPKSVDTLMEELEAQSRPLTAVEDSMLLHRRVTINNEVNRAERARDAAREAGDTTEEAANKLQMDRALDERHRLDEITRASGWENSTGLSARRMVATEDYSLATMITEKRAAGSGERLSPEDQAKVERQHERIAKTQEAVDAHEEARTNKESDNAFSDHSAEVENVQPLKVNLPSNWAVRVAAARERIKSKGSTARGGLDPELLVDYSIVGVDMLAKGVVSLARFTKELVSEFGEKIRDNVPEIWRSAHEYLADIPKEEGEKPTRRKTKPTNPAEAYNESEKRPQDLSRLARDIEEGLLRDGVKDRNQRLDAVHKELQNTEPEITRRETMDALSGYGKFTPLSKDAIKAELRKGHGEMQQIAKLEDMLSGKAPLKTGMERRTPSDLERRLIKQVNEMKKRLGFIVTDPVKQLKSALDAIKTRLTNSIADLEHEIGSGQRIVKNRSRPPTDAEVEKLRARADELRAQRDALFGKRGLTDEQKIGLAKAGIERSIAEYERRIKEKDLFPERKKITAPTSDALEALKAKRDALKAELKELQLIERPPKTSEERALAALKKRLTSRTAELQDKLAKGDFSKKERKPVAMDEEAMRLKAANERAKADFQAGLRKDQMAKRAWWQKLLDGITRVRREFVLSSPLVFPKLAAAAAARLVTSPIEEGIGAGFSKLLPKVAGRAPSESGLNLRAEAKAASGAIKGAMEDSWKQIKHNASDLDVMYGDKQPNKMVNFFGRLHAAMKAPVKRAAFERSLEKRMAFAAANGENIGNPLTMMRIQLEAYKDANRSIFLQDNKLSSALSSAMGALEAKSKTTGKASVGGKIAATAMRVAMPIVRVPTNIVAEALQYSLGLGTGSARLVRAIAGGMENLKPEEADAILRSFKKGSLGAGLLLLGYMNPNSIGGYYRPGQTRGSDEAKFGSIRIGGVNIPSFLLHNPLLETLQIGATARQVMDQHIKKGEGDIASLAQGGLAATLGLIEHVPLVKEQVDLAKLYDPRQRDKFIGQQAKDLVVPQAVSFGQKYFGAPREMTDKTLKSRTLTDSMNIWSNASDAQKAAARDFEQLKIDRKVKSGKITDDERAKAERYGLSTNADAGKQRLKDAAKAARDKKKK